MAPVPAISEPLTNAMLPHPTHPSHHRHPGSAQAARIPPALLICIIIIILVVFCFILMHWVFEPCLDFTASSRHMAIEWDAEDTEMQQQSESQSDESEDSSESESESNSESESDSESGIEEVETQKKEKKEEEEEEEGCDWGRESEESLYLGDNEEDEDESSLYSMYQSSTMAMSVSEDAAEDTPDSDEEENQKDARIKDHSPVVLGDGFSSGYGTF
ncbi:hypothetical protein BP6252_03884 [Coleophoma cylindrospora]|uniref:Uncharacterized protein n=1 Tax=Coleophoma cylindrospora TaxID=1849047 RepID=A0A3D8S8U9_9HELO|nr:hypothetical protein BP6252_03884 [Coleophoma cylindrospora]